MIGNTAINSLEAREGDNIYVESISRLGRNVDDLRLIAKEFKDKDVTVHFIKEGFNTGNNNNMFKFMLTILGAVAEMERELTVERIREGFARLIGVSRPTLYKYIQKFESEHVEIIKLGHDKPIYT